MKRRISKSESLFRIEIELKKRGFDVPVWTDGEHILYDSKKLKHFKFSRIDDNMISDYCGIMAEVEIGMVCSEQIIHELIKDFSYKLPNTLDFILRYRIKEVNWGSLFDDGFWERRDAYES